MPTVRPHTRAVGQIVGAALCWSLGGVLIKLVPWPALAVSGGRGGIAALFLLLTNRRLRFTLSRVQILGAVGYAACTILFCLANKDTTAANAILLQYTAPIWIALFGNWFLGERATVTDWITIGAVLGGMALFFEDSLVGGHGFGNAIALASGVAFAGMTLALRKQKDASATESIILGNLLAFAVGLRWMIHAPALSLSGGCALLTLGVVQLGISYWLYTRAIRQITALEAVLLPVIEPLLNPVWVLLTVGERPSLWSLAGGVVVLTAVTLRAAGSVRRGRSAPSAAEVSTG